MKEQTITRYYCELCNYSSDDASDVRSHEEMHKTKDARKKEWLAKAIIVDTAEIPPPLFSGSKPISIFTLNYVPSSLAFSDIYPRTIEVHDLSNGFKAAKYQLIDAVIPTIEINTIKE